MKVLVIAYYFPPFGGGASERFHCFVKYLPAFGITPLVLSVDEAYYEDIYRDQELLAEYPPEVSLYRSSVIFGNKLKQQKSRALLGAVGRGVGSNLNLTFKKFIKQLIVPDEQVFWVLPALVKARQIFRNNDIRAIVATAPPFSSHLVGAMLSWKYGVPLLLDYRDLWHLNPAMLGKGIHAELNGLIERVILARADAVSCTNQAAADALKGHYGLAPWKVHVIENGFEALKIAAVMRSVPDNQSQGKIRITYLGSLTKERTPIYFLGAFKRLIAEYPQRDLEVVFVGYTSAEHRKLVDEMGLSNWVHFYGTVSKEVALDIMCNQSEILLILQRSSEGGRTSIPGKLYEYLGTGKPLVCVDEGLGITSRFLQEFGLINCIAEYKDEEGIYKILQSIILEYGKSCEIFRAFKEKMKNYDRKYLTMKMARLLKILSVKTDRHFISNQIH